MKRSEHVSFFLKCVNIVNYQNIQGECLKRTDVASGVVWTW